MMFVAAAALFTSCSEVNKVQEPTDGSISFAIFNDEVTTKAYTGSVAYEKKINSLDVYLFEAGQTLYYHERCVPGGTKFDANKFDWSFTNTGDGFSGTLKKIPITTDASKYTLVFVANMPAAALSGQVTIANIENVVVALSNMSTDENKGFAMYAKKANIVVTAGDQASSAGEIQLERFTSRVRLVSVTNTIPASANYSNGNKITVNGIFVSNVASSWKLGGEGNPSTIVNVAGKNNNANITPSNRPATDNAVTGYFPTAVDVAQSATATALGWNSYAMPTVAANKGASLPKLVICAIVNGTPYYYPVELLNDDRSGIDRNKSYDVTVSISGTGSLDPDVVVARGSLSATVEIAPWESGGDYPENI